MGIGVSIFLIAVGAILAFAVNFEDPAVNLYAVGVILMIVGIIGALVSALFLSSWSPYPYRTVRSRGLPADEVEVRERRTY